MVVGLDWAITKIFKRFREVAYCFSCSWCFRWESPPSSIRGPGAEWVRSSSGGILYVMFWMFLVMTIWPRLSPWRVALAVLLVTSVLEVLQLWHPPLLTAVRNTFVGHALLGSTFSWWDFPHYLLGCVLGVALAGAIQKP